MTSLFKFSIELLYSNKDENGITYGIHWLKMEYIGLKFLYIPTELHFSSERDANQQVIRHFI